MSPADRRRAELKSAEWAAFRALFGRLREATRPDVLALAKSSPELAAEGLRSARFTPEFRECMNLLGDLGRAESRRLLEGLAGASNADIAGFARARLAAEK